jgi:hypothetical protein
MNAQRGEDAQRELEQRALRNVRGLVEHMERDDRASQRTQWKIVAGIVVGVVVLMVALLVLTDRQRKGALPGEVREVPAQKPGQVVPQGPRAPQ